MSFTLTSEERFLWDCARFWRIPDRISIPESLDWVRVAGVGVHNRMAVLLEGILKHHRRWDGLPEAARTELAESASGLRKNAEVMGASLADYLRTADARGLQTVVIKGFSISINCYGDPNMRPGGDIDVLVRPRDVRPSIDILEAVDIGPYWPNLMDDAYYERHHLHLQRCSRDLALWYEVHWALDHPYTLFTIDYEAMLDRTTPGELLGSPVRDLTPSDLLLTLAIHLVKHAIYLPDALAREDLARGVLADGLLMYFLDIHEALYVYRDELDWDALLDLSQETGAVEVFGSVFRACRRLLGSDIPERVLASLPVRGNGPVTRAAMNHVLDREIAQYLGVPPSRFWDIMLVTNGAFILRPIRLIESVPYFFPGEDFLVRRYQKAGFLTRLAHFFGAVREFTLFAWDSIYFAVERYRRLKRIGYSTSLFNRLETGE